MFESGKSETYYSEINR